MSNEILTDFCKAVRNSTLKRLRVVPEGYENWRISKNALSFAEIAKHLIEIDEWTINKINDPAIESILPEEGSIENCDGKSLMSSFQHLKKAWRKRLNFLIRLTVKR